MRTTELIKEIERLPLQKRIFVIERLIHSIRQREDKNQMRQVADLLFADYKNDSELTVFSNLDYEDFYETR